MPSTLEKPRRARPRARDLAGNEARWAAVVARDAGADGKFFAAVATTGFYCRPSCAARRPKRENVRFFSTCADAEAAGYRPCKRCKPNAPPLHKEHAEKIARACRLIVSTLHFIIAAVICQPEAQRPPNTESLARSASV